MPIATKEITAEIRADDAEHGITIQVLPDGAGDGDLMINMSMVMRTPEGDVIRHISGARKLTDLVLAGLYTPEDAVKFKDMLFTVGSMIAQENGCTIIDPTP
jgi:hypothetical protein